jgi:DNA polymerase III delta subunit
MIAVILGPDSSMVRAEVRSRVDAADPSGQSTSTIDGKISGLHDVQMAVASIGFFSAGRVIVVDDLIARLGKQGARDGASTPEWPALFGAVPEVTTLILADPSIGTLPAAVKKALPPDANVTICDPPRGRDLIRWIQTRARDVGTSMDDATARMLAKTLYPQTWTTRPNNPAFDRPPDLELLGNEVAKLAVTAAPEPISAAHVQSMTMQGDTDQIFAFIDAASSGRLGQAITELDHLLAAGEDPYKLLAQLSQTAELSVVMGASAGRQPADVGRSLKLPNANRMTAIARGLRNQPPHLAPRAADVLKSADKRLKTGELRNPVDALYEAITRIASARS